MPDLRYPVELAGRKFMVDRSSNRFGRRSIPLQKAQQDTSAVPGEQSLNSEDLWRRSFESWHRGAGQEFFDWEDGDPFRFRSSLGVDPWTKKRLSLLAETEAKLASTATTVKLAVAGGYLYCADGQTLKYTTSITAAGAASWTTVTGTPSATITGLTSDGYNVWASFGSSGIYKTTRGAATASAYTVKPADVLDFVKGRLMVAKGRTVANVTETSYPSALSVWTTGSTQPNQVPADGDVISIGTLWPDGQAEHGITLVVFTYSGSGSITLPDGWTYVGTGVQLSGGSCQSFAAWRPTSSYERDDFLVSGSLNSWAYSKYLLLNADDSNPIDSYAVTTSSTPTSTLVSPTATTLQVNDLAVTAIAAVGAVSRSVSASPGGTSSETDITSTLTTDYSVTGMASKAIASPAATGTFSWTMSGNVDSYVTWTINLKTYAGADLFTHANTDFTWVGFAEGQGDIYAAGYSGDKSLIYRTQVRADGTALDAPVVAGSLPDGEIVRGIYGYLGLLFIGTDSGVRMATSDANGDLTIGALIETAGPVRCFEGQGRFVWFGLEDYDISRWGSGTYDGLGRLDLTQQTDTLVPAWASDLMAEASTSTTESVQSVVTFQERRLFAIGSSNGLTRGVYGEKANRVTVGYLDSGLVTYGISDTKVATYVDLRHKSLVGTLEVYTSADEAAFASIGTSTTGSSTRPATDPMPVGPDRGDAHEVRLRLNRVNGSDNVGPTVTRATLRSEPAPARGRIRQWPLVLSSKDVVAGQDVGRDPAADLAFIDALFDTQTLVSCREDNSTFTAFLRDYEFVADTRSADGKTEQGICVVTLKEPAS